MYILHTDKCMAEYAILHDKLPVYIPSAMHIESDLNEPENDSESGFRQAFGCKYDVFRSEF